MGATRLRDGFTLIEMLVVVVIIGILVAVSIPALFRAVEDARRRSCAASMRNIESAAGLYAAQHAGNYPADDGITCPVFVTNGTYFPDGAPSCPWGTAYDWSATARGIVNKATHFSTWPTCHN